MSSKPFGVVTALSLVIIGCSNDTTNPMMIFPTPIPNLVISPADGQADVRLDAEVILTFAQPVDPAVIERDVHLISERGLADSLCPDTTMITHGGMGNVMMDSTMMRHMSQVHAMRGRFMWNGDSTECSFRPDSMMTPLTTYMVHTGPEMMQMMRTRMGDMGMMGGHGFGMMQDDMMLHFVTMDTSGTDDGHGHH